MRNAAGEDLIGEFAPADVRATVGWLKAHDFSIIHSDTARGTFGSCWWFVQGDTQVNVTVDRSQWCLDIMPGRGGRLIQYDVLVAAQRGQDYREGFPRTGSDRPAGRPSQLPAGVSWRSTLPDVLAWLSSGAYDAAAVERAQDQRYVQMWPDSPKARRLLRNWGERQPGRVQAR